MKQGKAKFRSRGASIVEMMVAMALGVMITAGVLSVFLSVKTSYATNERSARIQEIGRVAIFLLSQDLKHAHFWGPLLNVDHLEDAFPSGRLSGPCSSWASSASTSPYVPVTNRFIASTNPASNLVFTGSCLETTALQSGASAVAIKRVGENPVSSAAEFNALASNTVLLRTHSVNGTLVTKSAAGYPPPAGQDYWVYQPGIYYIRDYAETAGDGIPTLCMVRGNPVLQNFCLVEGVEDMHIEYGIDIAGRGVPGIYKSSPTVDEMLRAVTVKIYLLVRDPESDPRYTHDKGYQLGSKTVATITDNYHRAVFSTTIIPHNQRYLPIR